MGRLILDTGVLVEAERGNLDLSGFRNDDDLAVAAITITELRLGIALAEPVHGARRQVFLERALEIISVEDYTMGTTGPHADLLAHTRRQGRPRGKHDLIIAATAVVTKRTLLTTDKAAKFDDLPGVKCVEITTR